MYKSNHSNSNLKEDKTMQSNLGNNTINIIVLIIVKKKKLNIIQGCDYSSNERVGVIK